MEVLRDGTFVFSIGSGDLSKGIRPSKRVPRNSKFLVTCEGGVGRDGVLQVIDDLEMDRIDVTATILEAFPYPQVFVFTEAIIFCDSQNIYEWDGLALNLMLGPVTAGTLWSAVAYGRFIFMTNGAVSVVKSSTSGVYSLTTDYPAAEAAGHALVRAGSSRDGPAASRPLQRSMG